MAKISRSHSYPNQYILQLLASLGHFLTAKSRNVSERKQNGTLNSQGGHLEDLSSRLKSEYWDFRRPHELPTEYSATASEVDKLTCV